METPFNKPQDTQTSPNPLGKSLFETPKKNSSGQDEDDTLKLFILSMLRELNPHWLWLGCLWIIFAFVLIRMYANNFDNRHDLYTVNTILRYTPITPPAPLQALSTRALEITAWQTFTKEYVKILTPKERKQFDQISIKWSTERSMKDLLHLDVFSPNNEGPLAEIVDSYMQAFLIYFNNYWDQRFTQVAKRYQDTISALSEPLEIVRIQIREQNKEDELFIIEEQLPTLKQTILTQKQEIDALQLQISNHTSLLAEIDDFMLTPEVKSIPYIEQRDLLELEIRNLQSEIMRLAQKYTPLNPKLKMSHTLLANLKEECAILIKKHQLENVSKSILAIFTHGQDNHNQLTIELSEMKLKLSNLLQFNTRNKEDLIQLTQLKTDFDALEVHQDRLQTAISQHQYEIDQLEKTKLLINGSLNIIKPCEEAELNHVFGMLQYLLCGILALILTSSLLVLVILLKFFFGRVHSHVQIQAITGIKHLANIPQRTRKNVSYSETALVRAQTMLKDYFGNPSVLLFLPLQGAQVFTANSPLRKAAKWDDAFIMINIKAFSTHIYPSDGLDVLYRDSSSHFTGAVLHRDFISPRHINKLNRDIEKLKQIHKVVFLYYEHETTGREPFIQQIQPLVTGNLFIARWGKTTLSSLRSLARLDVAYSKKTAIFLTEIAASYYERYYVPSHITRKLHKKKQEENEKGSTYE